MSIDFEYDLTSWAFLLDVDWCRAYINISVLCFRLKVWLPAFHEAFPEETPEEALRQLNQYTDETLQFISEERESIHRRMGIETR